MADQNPETIQSIEWKENHLRIIDQTFLPKRTVYIDLNDVGRVWEAIKKLRVRGAPAIGIAAAYGFYLGIKDLPEQHFNSFWIEVERIADYLASSRPTAVNLNWALNRLKNTVYANKEKSIPEIKEHILKIAKTIHDEDKRICKLIGQNGQELIGPESRILTHCNTGSLATGQYGTALSVIYHAHEAGKKIHVWVDETRPLLQGARLTAWELERAGIEMSLITDSTAGYLMSQKKVDLVIVGADRVASNGDTANKIGTYSLSVLAKEHNIPFYVALPLSTFDINLENGAGIPIEERDADEIRKIANNHIAPEKVDVYNPAFDVTPADNITAFVTEAGIIRPDYKKNIRSLFSDG